MDSNARAARYCYFGCTHFPLLIEELEKVLPNGTRFIDSGSAIARRTVWLINQEEIANSEEENFAYCLLMDDNAKDYSQFSKLKGSKRWKTSYLSQIWWKAERTEKYEKGCQIFLTPYNAHPLTGTRQRKAR